MSARGPQGQEGIAQPKPSAGRETKFTLPGAPVPQAWVSGAQLCTGPRSLPSAREECLIGGHCHFPAVNFKTKPKHIFLHFSEQRLLN